MSTGHNARDRDPIVGAFEEHKRSASNRDIIHLMSKRRRNSKCVCGSGKKFKHCHLAYYNKHKGMVDTL